MPIAGFRLTDNTDLEERQEEDALWAALKNHYGEKIVSISDNDLDIPNFPVFGRTSKHKINPIGVNPISSYLPYWNDPVFDQFSRRSSKVCNFEEAKIEFERLQEEGTGVFLKSTKMKHFIDQAPAIGVSFYDVMGAMAYSFIDGGPKILVQELVKMEFEHRFFVIDDEIVTHSPVQYPLTPYNHPLPPYTVSKTPNGRTLETKEKIFKELYNVAKTISEDMIYPHASVDCAIIYSNEFPEGAAGIIEMNPMQLGQLGLYACDVDKLAGASEILLYAEKYDDDYSSNIIHKP